jgi:multidrug efflux pump subunit AcrB
MDFPQGTDIGKTNQATKILEKNILNTISKYKDDKTGDNFLIESMITQVGKGAINPQVDAGSQADTPYKSKITINFVEYAERRGINTTDVLEEIRKSVPQIPGASITVEKQASGPPVGYPISIELKGDDYNQLLSESNRLISFINSKNISGIEKLQSDVNKDSPELIIDIDREVAGNLGVSTAYTGLTLRRAMFGQDISTLKDIDEDYQIAVRLQEDQRRNQSALFNQPITFQNNKGQLLQIPISTFARFNQEKTFSKIKRKDNVRTLMVYSNITKDANANEIAKLQKDMKNYQLPEGVSYKFAGEQEEQGKNQNFLFLALFLAMAMVTGIIVFQFNSMSKTIIIMTTILLSFSGVFLGLTVFKMDFVILMTMMGIISRRSCREEWYCIDGLLCSTS